ncbi:MAG: hypothetical protein IPO27_00045 [Bacteroidetes bacterium]|nr:hypothetical protein [Bacteroidota bacterium]
MSNLSATSINQSLVPSTNNSKDLGSSSFPWNVVYPISIKFPDGSIQSTAFVPTAINQSLLPSTNNTKDLGSGSLAWRDIYFDGSLFSSSGRVFNAGVNNVAIGRGALFSNFTGLNNIAIGDSALSYNTSGQSNIAIGINALLNNVNGGANIAIGA